MECHSLCTYFNIGHISRTLRLYFSGDCVYPHGPPEIRPGLVHTCHTYSAPFEGQFVAVPLPYLKI